MSRSLNLIKGTLDVLILKTLSWGPMHGYAISRHVRLTTHELLTVEEGALYPALRRMEKRGWLESSWALTDTHREAKFYQLTPAGKAQLEEELSSWERYVQAMSRVLEGVRPEPVASHG